MAGQINPEVYHALARECGFQLSGIAQAVPHIDAIRYQNWLAEGFHGEMGYLADHRAEKRTDPKALLPSAESVLCLGMLYNGPEPRSTQFDDYERGWIARYAWGEDYHDVIRNRLQDLTNRLLKLESFDFKLCCDTAPLLERSYARQAGLGWVGKNTCLIHEGKGSWFFLAEILTSLRLPPGNPPPDRCGSCTRCIDACPTNAIVRLANNWAIDSRRCISYFTIELRGAIPESGRPLMGNHVFGCDICQDVCPWNQRAPVTAEVAYGPAHFAPPLERLCALTEAEFRNMFRGSPVNRARYSGFLRNVAVAMGNAGTVMFREPLERMAQSEDHVVAEHARWALSQPCKT